MFHMHVRQPPSATLVLCYLVGLCSSAVIDILVIWKSLSESSIQIHMFVYIVGVVPLVVETTRMKRVGKRPKSVRVDLLTDGTYLKATNFNRY